MSDEQNSWTLVDSTRASMPGNLKVNPFIWIRFYPIWPLIWFLSLFLSSALTYFYHWLFLIPVIILTLINIFYWQRVTEHFLYGCVNPAVIISLNPVKFAVSTDLSKGTGEYPVIKIIEKNLSKVCGKKTKIGAVFPTIALYQKSDETLPYWDNFFPYPVDCATNNIEIIKNILHGFTEEDIAELKFGLTQIQKPYKCGLYFIKS